jgi:cytochrome c2
MREVFAAGLGAGALAFAVVALAFGIQEEPEGETAASRSPSPAAPRMAARVEDDSGRAIFGRMGCGSCHTLAAAGSKGQIGPNLDERLRRHDRASLIARITAPAATESFSAMPTDFGSRMNARELDTLVRFLLAAR